MVTVSPLVSTSKFTPPESHPTLWVRVSGVVTVLLPLAGENVRRALGSEIPSVGVAARTRDSSQRAGVWAGRGLALGFFRSGLQVRERAGAGRGPRRRQACWYSDPSPTRDPAGSYFDTKMPLRSSRSRLSSSRLRA